MINNNLMIEVCRKKADDSSVKIFSKYLSRLSSKKNFYHNRRFIISSTAGYAQDAIVLEKSSLDARHFYCLETGKRIQVLVVNFGT